MPMKTVSIVLKDLSHQKHNPLDIKIGDEIGFCHDGELSNIKFSVERILNYESNQDGDIQCYIDYDLLGNLLEKPIYFRLRLFELSVEPTYQIMLLHNYDEIAWNSGFYKNALCNQSGQFLVMVDDHGFELKEPKKFWRIDESLESFTAKVTVLSDEASNFKDLEHYNINFWDFHRLTVEICTQKEKTEYLYVEMDEIKKNFSFLRGFCVEPSEIILY